MDRARKREATSVRKKFQRNADVSFDKLVVMFVYGLVSSTNGLLVALAADNQLNSGTCLSYAKAAVDTVSNDIQRPMHLFSSS